MIAITYATENYKKQQLELEEELYKSGFKLVINYGVNDIDDAFYFLNRNILTQTRGAGSALWKPYFINKTLQEYNDDVLYMDCGDKIVDFNFKEYVENILSKNNFFIVENLHRNSHHTRRDCFTLMGCDSEEYWDHGIMEAGICAFKKDLQFRYFIHEWLDWCQVEEVVMDVKNKDLFGRQNLPGYTNHKCDQSILTNLVVKYKIPTVSIYDVMQYVGYNFRG